MNRKTIQFLVTMLIPFAIYAQTELTTAEPTEPSTPPEEAAESVASGVARGVTEATMEVSDAVRGSGAAVAEQGSSVWHDVLVPMYQRFAAALPGVVKALLVLAGFWVLAVLAGAGVTRLLKMTNLDERAAKDWGLGGIAGGSLETLAGTTVKWVILLFGFVAFFQSINLPMVAGPLQNVVAQILNAVPNILNAAVILLAYWVVASLLKMAITKGLTAVKFDDRAKKYFPPREVRGETVGPSALVGRLVFYVVLLFGIPPFLQALNQEALVEPLQKMLGNALGFLPNIVAAVIILLIGNVVATILREVSVNFLAAAGFDSLASRFSLSKLAGARRLSDIVGTLVYFVVIIPVVVAAVDTLGLDALSSPVKATLEKIATAVPGVLGGLIIFIAGFAIAKAVRELVESFLAGIGTDHLPEKLGLPFARTKEGGTSLSMVLSNIVMAIILILTAQQALAVVGLQELTSLLDEFVRYLPKLAAGVLILCTAIGIGNYVSGLIIRATDGAGQTKVVAAVARYAILFLGISMTLNQLGVAREIVITAVTAVLGGVALALGIAFGLGGKDKAKEFLDKSLPS